MKKLTFGEAAKNFNVLTDEQMREIIAGDGVVVSGTGTSTDPYVIKSKISISTIGMSSDVKNGISSGIAEYNNMSPTAVNGCYYKFNIESDEEGIINSTTSYKNASGQTVTVNDTKINRSPETPTSSYVSGAPVFGKTDSSNQVTLYDENMTGLSGMSMKSIVTRSVVHEIGHSFGLSEGSGIMGSFEATASGSITSAPGSLNADALKGMLSGGRIGWQSGVVTP